MSAAMLAWVKRISNELGRKGLSRFTLKVQKFNCIDFRWRRGGSDRPLARQEAKLGLISLDVARKPEDLVKLVG